MKIKSKGRPVKSKAKKLLPYRKPAITAERRLDVMAGACGNPPTEKNIAGPCDTVVARS